jgi:DNA-binding transcriptional ArsR family regulator
MTTNPLTEALTPDVETLLDCLSCEDCRRILGALDGPKTAEELTEACDIPRSTVYRKLTQMVRASLVEKRAGRDGDPARFAVAFDEAVVGLDDDAREFEVSVSEPPRTVEEQLHRTWESVRRET